MPSFRDNTFASFYQRIFQVNQTSNTGIDSTVRQIQTGDGVDVPVSMSTDKVHIQPTTGNKLDVFKVGSVGGSSILKVDTIGSYVYVGSEQVHATTMYKDMGLYDFSPTIGVHNPLIANNMMFSDSGDDIVEDDSMFGSGDDPAATLDLSADGTAKIAVACYWYLSNDITLDNIRYMATADSNSTVNFHVESYDLDTSSQHGDLSGGTTQATVEGIALTSSTVKTGTLTISAPSVAQNKIVIGFIESDATGDLTCSLNIKYHIQ